MESDEEDVSTDGSSTITRHSLDGESQSVRGEYVIQKMPSVTAMYGTELEDNNDEEKEENNNVSAKERQNRLKKEQDNEYKPSGIIE